MHLTRHQTLEISVFQGCFADVLINKGVSKGVVLKMFKTKNIDKSYDII